MSWGSQCSGKAPWINERRRWMFPHTSYFPLTIASGIEFQGYRLTQYIPNLKVGKEVISSIFITTYVTFSTTDSTGFYKAEASHKIRLLLEWGCFPNCKCKCCQVFGSLVLINKWLGNMINMTPHCLAVRRAPGEQCGESIWRTGCSWMVHFRGILVEKPHVPLQRICARTEGWTGEGPARTPSLLEVGAGRRVTWNRDGYILSQTEFGTQTCPFQAMWNLARELASLTFYFISLLMAITPVADVNIEWDFECVNACIRSSS